MSLSAGYLQNEPDSYKRGLEHLRATYTGGLDFTVLTPVFLTLRQQTLQRLQDAGLKNSDGSDPEVLPYAFSAQTAVMHQLSCNLVVHALPMQRDCTRMLAVLIATNYDFCSAHQSSYHDLSLCDGQQSVHSVVFAQCLLKSMLFATCTLYM